MKRNIILYKTCLLIIIPLFITAACKKDQIDNYAAEVRVGELQLNPYGYAPLAAALEVEVSKGDVVASVKVLAKSEIDSDHIMDITLSSGSGKQVLPVLGLYPDHKNEIEIALRDINGRLLSEVKEVITTGPLPFEFNEAPVIKGNMADNEMIFTVLFSDFNLSSSGTGSISYVEYATIFDKNGNVRWYSEFKNREHWVMEVIDNHIYAGSAGGIHKSELIKYNFLGEEVEVHNISLFGERSGFEKIHHDIKKTTNETFLLTVNGIDHPSIENFIIEYDPLLTQNNTQSVINLEEILPNVDDLFLDLPQSYSPGKTDAIHNNGIYPYSDGRNVLVSSQRCGLAKVNINTGTLIWYFFPHKVKAAPGYDKSTYSEEPAYDENNYQIPHESWRAPANSEFPSQDYQFSGVFNYNTFLLQPIDASGSAITDDNVVWEGQAGADFSYPYRQHSPVILENGNILVFDNGLMRDFIPARSFSRAIEYKVTEDNNDGYGGTVQQVWDYTPSLNDSYFSPVGGGVRELENGNRLVTFGSIGFMLSADMSPEQKEIVSQNTKAYIVEVTSTMPAQEVFSLTLNTKSIGMTAYSADKIRF